MAQAMASMAGLRGSSQAVLEGSLQVSGSTRMNIGSGMSTRVTTRAGFNVRAQQQQQVNGGDATSSRRAMLSLVAAGLATGSFVQAVLADAKPIKVGPPPPPSGGLPGTLNSDEARDLDLPLKERFFLQPLTPSEAAQRAKESAKEIVGVKKLIEKKAWPYVQNDLRLRAEYLRFDLNTVIAAKPKDEKKSEDNSNGYDATSSVSEASPFVGQWQGKTISFMQSNEHRNHETHRKWDTSGLEGLSLKLVQSDQNARNWWRKLDIVRDIISLSLQGEDRLEALLYSAIYLKWINTGQISCFEDGGHHRPIGMLRFRGLYFVSLSDTLVARTYLHRKF